MTEAGYREENVHLVYEALQHLGPQSFNMKKPGSRDPPKVSRHMEYVSWNDEEWSAVILPGRRFMHTRKGATSHTDTVLNYKNHDGSRWTLRLMEDGQFLLQKRGTATSSHSTSADYMGWSNEKWQVRLLDGEMPNFLMDEIAFDQPVWGAAYQSVILHNPMQPAHIHGTVKWRDQNWGDTAAHIYLEKTNDASKERHILSLAAMRDHGPTEMRFSLESDIGNNPFWDFQNGDTLTLRYHVGGPLCQLHVQKLRVWIDS